MKASRSLDALVAMKVMGMEERQPPMEGYKRGVWAYAINDYGLEGPIYVVDAPCYSSEFPASWEVLDLVKCWPFSKRQSFKDTLQREISKRLNLRKGILVAHEEILLQVEPVDIAISALKAVGHKFEEERDDRP